MISEYFLCRKWDGFHYIDQMNGLKMNSFTALKHIDDTLRQFLDLSLGKFVHWCQLKANPSTLCLAFRVMILV